MPQHNILEIDAQYCAPLRRECCEATSGLQACRLEGPQATQCTSIARACCRVKGEEGGEWRGGDRTEGLRRAGVGEACRQASAVREASRRTSCLSPIWLSPIIRMPGTNPSDSEAALPSHTFTFIVYRNAIADPSILVERSRG